jgi:cation:H+ antiporter
MLVPMWVWGRLGASISLTHGPARTCCKKMLARPHTGILPGEPKRDGELRHSVCIARAGNGPNVDDPLTLGNRVANVLPDFENQSVWMNALIFAAMAAIIWYAGTKLERQADGIAHRTGLGHAFIGVVLLAAATSLPEIATTVTAVWIDNLPMAVNNLLGSVVFNTAALAIADAVSGPSALTHRSPRYVLIMAGAGVVLLLALVVMGGAMGRGSEEMPSAGVWLVQFRFWEVLIVLGYLGLMYATHRGQNQPRWQPTSAIQSASGVDKDEEASDTVEETSTWIYGAFALTSAVILVTAWVLTQTGDALATQTGLGGGFVGFAFIALATTLPEISTTVAAARAGNDNMAVTNIFGSSAFVPMLLGLLGLFMGGEVLLEAASPAGSFAVGLGMAVTLTYLWGLLEHEDRAILGIGWDSTVVIVLVLGGSWVMYMLELPQETQP